MRQQTELSAEVVLQMLDEEIQLRRQVYVDHEPLLETMLAARNLIVANLRNTEGGSE